MTPPAQAQARPLLFLGAQTPSTLRTPLRATRVTKGELILFLSRGPETHARQYLASVPEGELLFDIGWESLNRVPLSLFADSLPDTATEAIDPAALPAESLANHLDRWMQTLLTAILNLGEEESAFTHAILPGTEVPALAPGEIIGLRKGIGWWRANGADALPGITHRYLHTAPPVDVYLPLIPRLGMEITAQIPASRLLTTSELLAQPDWPAALAGTHSVLAEALEKALDHREAAQRHLAGERQELSAAAYEQGWLELAEVMGAPASPASGPAAEARTVEIAFERVTRHMGIPSRAQALPLEATTPIGKVAELSRNASLRWRQVLLQGEWYRINSGPLVGILGETQEAVALLPQGSGRYRMIMADGRSRMVNQEISERLAPEAATLYRTLPPHRLKLRDLLRFSLQGSFSDGSLIVAMIVITGLLGLATPALSARIYDVIIPQSERGLMLQIALILGVAALTQSLFELARSFALMRIENRANSHLQAAVWDRLLRLPTRFFRQFTSGDLANRVQGVTDAHQILASTGVTLLFTLPTGGFNLLIMFWHSHILALWGLGIALAGALLAVGFNAAEVLILRREYEVRGKLSGMVVQMINGVGKLRMANAENFAFNTWSRQYATQEQLAMKAGRWGVISQTVFSAFPLLVSAILFALVGCQLGRPASAAPAFTTGSFLAFNAAFGALIGSLVTVARESLGLLQLFPLLERTKPIFEAEPEAQVTRVHPGSLEGEVEINNLSFTYRQDTPPVLDRLSLKILPGEMVAIVGPSGCGKSTLLRLLLGFETPDSGTIFYDGKDLQTLQLQEVRRQIGVVLQNTQLFAGDIFRNIAGESNLTMEEAWHAATMAGLADDIRNMPMGMHTVVSEGGTSFSGGQKQRLAIARAFAHRPRLLVFDEATSALDNRTQAMVTDTMERLQVTRIVVAHRLSTIVRAQRIIVLDHGRICEEGTFDALMAKRGVFYELARHQMA